MSTPEPTTPTTPIENVPRGTIFALVIIPAGIIVWCILWQLGFIASIVAFGVALGAMWLYRFGAGGRISRTGAVRVTVITVVTLVLSFFAGLVTSFAIHFHLNPVDALTSPRLLPTLMTQITSGGVGVSLLIAAVFGVLGCFSVLRTAWVQTSNANAAGAAFGQPGAQPYTIQAPSTTPTVPESPASPADPADPKRD